MPYCSDKPYTKVYFMVVDIYSLSCGILYVHICTLHVSYCTLRTIDLRTNFDQTCTNVHYSLWFLMRTFIRVYSFRGMSGLPYVKLGHYAIVTLCMDDYPYSRLNYVCMIASFDT